MKGKFFRRINSIIITYDEKDGTYYIYGKSGKEYYSTKDPEDAEYTAMYVDRKGHV